MVVRQTTRTWFLLIFLVASCITTTAATTITQKNSTNYLCNPGNSTDEFKIYLGLGIKDLNQTAKSDRRFKYYSPVHVGSYNRIVHVSYLCQGDITGKSCSSCVWLATQTAQSKCNGSTEGIVYEEECTFRYSDKPFYGRFDDSSLWVDLDDNSLPNSVSVSQFGEALNETVEKIGTSLRSSPNYGPKNGTWEAKVDDNITIYAMGECSWDLYQEDCRSCIHECALNVVTAGKVRGLVKLPSCNFRYDTTRFYEDGARGQTPLPLPPLPPLPQALRAKARKKVDKIAAAAGSGGGLGGLLVGSVLSWAYQKRKVIRSDPVYGDPDIDEDDSPGDDPENPDPPAGGATGTDVSASDPKEGSDDVANDEDSKKRIRKPASKPSKGNKKNTAKKPAPKR